MSFQLISKKKLVEFEKLLCQEELILKCILNVITNDKEEDISLALMNIYWANSQDMPIVEKTCIPTELERTPEPGLLFRGNTTFIFMMSEFLRLNGGEYLRKTLRPAIKFYLKKDTVHYEIDPKRIDSLDNMGKHINNVTGAAQYILDTLLKSVESVPASVRDMLRMLHAGTEARFPGSGYRTLGALFFLRFVCPTIVSPVAYALIKEKDKAMTPASQRGLILVAKVIQSIANESTTFEKEEYMKPLTELVNKNIPNVHQFYDAIIKGDYKPPKPVSRSSCPPHHLLLIARFLRLNAEKVHAQMLEEGASESVWTKLQPLLDTIAPPPAATAAGSSSKLANSTTRTNASSSESVSRDPDVMEVSDRPLAKSQGSLSDSDSASKQDKDKDSKDTLDPTGKSPPTALSPSTPPRLPKKPAKDKDAKEAKDAKSAKQRPKDSVAPVATTTNAPPAAGKEGTGKLVSTGAANGSEATSTAEDKEESPVPSSNFVTVP